MQPIPSSFLRSVQRVSGASPSEIDRVRGVLCFGQRYLLARHNTRRLKNRSKWGLPGGRLNERERPKAALRRELIEELGYRVPRLVRLGDWQRGNETHRVFGCAVDRLITTIASDELLAVEWFTHAEVVRLAAASRLRTGFELDAIRTYRELTAHDSA